MKIGKITLENNFIFAPIAGYSDVGFRSLCAEYGAGLTVTEMVSAKGLNYNNPNSEVLLATTGAEKVVAVQLFGNDPEHILRACQNPLLDKFNIIDINMGCPVKKITSNGEGSALMKSPTLITELVRSAVEGGKRPVTVKLRAGFDDDNANVVECALAAESGGASAVTVHPRFRTQFYSGKADWSLIADVKQAVRIPVIANGDIVDKESVKAVKELTNCDAFMIARGALGKPYIFSELAGKTYKINTKGDILKQLEIMKKFMPERVVANNMKMHLCYYAKNIASPKAVRVAITSVKTIDDLLRVVDKYFI